MTSMSRVTWIIQGKLDCCRFDVDGEAMTRIKMKDLLRLRLRYQRAIPHIAGRPVLCGGSSDKSRFAAPWSQPSRVGWTCRQPSLDHDTGTVLRDA
jgi:hypothetical protein